MKPLVIYPSVGSLLEYTIQHLTNIYEPTSDNGYLYCGRMLTYDKIVSLISTYQFSEFSLSESKSSYVLKISKD